MATYSIIIPAYNAEATLGETLDAVIAQTLPDWECVVVDDGSIDRTASIARSYADADSRLRLLSQENRGTAGAYNAGVRASAGELIVLCSADDILLPQHLASMASLARCAPGFGIYSCAGDYLEASGARRPFYEGPLWEHDRSLTFEEVLDRCFFGVGAMFRRVVFDSIGGFREGAYGEDYDFWLRAMAIGFTHRYTPEVLAMHRLSASQKSADLARVLNSDIAILMNLRDSGLVSGEKLRAVERAISRREQLARQVSRRGRVLSATRYVLRAVLGERRAERFLRWALDARVGLRARAARLHRRVVRPR